ncbi:MAG: glycosyltransferase family 2 protein [bacterium]
MDLSVSIVNHSNRELLDGCLASVRAGAGELDFETIVIDNVSGDGSAAMAREKYPEVILIENEKRLGFAANQNQGLRRAKGEFVVLLNNDTVVGPGALEKLVAFMRANPHVGLAGPRLVNPDGSLQESCYRTPTLGVLLYDALFISSLFPGHPAFGGFKRWAHDSVREVPSISGACVMARKAAADEVGPLDERFFMYFEDHDWCLRFRRAGWKICFVPDARVVHYGGGSDGLLGHDRFDMFYRGMNLFYEKHYGRASLAAVAALNAAGAALRIAGWGALAPFSRDARVRFRERTPYFKRRIAWYLTGEGKKKRN